MSTETLLVDIVSAALAFFLVVLIAVLILIFKVLLSVKRVMKQAEKIANTAEEIGEAFRDASGPMALYRSIRRVNKIVKRRMK